MGRFTNSMAWKLAKWAKFVLDLTNTHVGKIKSIRKQNFKGEANNMQLDTRGYSTKQLE